jgi:hypothetical protein
MREGRITAVMTRAEATHERLVAAAADDEGDAPEAASIGAVETAAEVETAWRR